MITTDALLERFTLYDLLSYFIPGFICLCLVAGSFFPEVWMNYDSDTYEGLMGYIVFVILIFSYVLGMAISSIARLLCDGIFARVGKAKATGENEDMLNRALLNSGMQQDEIDAKRQQNQGTLSLTDTFASYIYSDIQADTNYKRIHNYASCEILYKNLACAFLLAAVVTLFLAHAEDWRMLHIMGYIYVFDVVMAAIFLFRWKRFQKKKMGYAVSWFIGKYVKKNRS